MNNDTFLFGEQRGLCCRTIFVIGFALILLWGIVTIIVTGVLIVHPTKDTYCSADYEYNATIVRLLPPRNNESLCDLCDFCVDDECEYYWYVEFKVMQCGKHINSMCTGNCETNETVKKYHFEEAYTNQTNIVLHRRCDANCYVLENGECCAFYYEAQHQQYDKYLLAVLWCAAAVVGIMLIILIIPLWEIFKTYAKDVRDLCRKRAQYRRIKNASRQTENEIYGNI